MPTITDEIKNFYKSGTALVKLIFINVAVFIILKLIFVIFYLYDSSSAEFQHYILTNLMLPADIAVLLKQPWTLISYMFLHFEFFHIIFNMIWLVWFGNIFLHYLNEKQLVNTYLLGGLAGGALYILAYNIFPGLEKELTTARALGASAAVTAIVVSVSFYAPNYEVNLLFIGPVKIKYIALFFIFTDLIQIASENAGGHIAHLGGALYGYFFAMKLRQGKDIGRFLGIFLDRISNVFKRKSRLKVTYHKAASKTDDFEYNKMKVQQQKEIDQILDKIAKSGYDSLTKKEKETLFKMSK